MFLKIEDNSNEWCYYIKFDEIKMVSTGAEFKKGGAEHSESFVVRVYFKELKDARASETVETFLVSKDERLSITNQMIAYNERQSKGINGDWDDCEGGTIQRAPQI